MRLLALDVGNTNVHAALFEGAAREGEAVRPAAEIELLPPDLGTGRAPELAAAASVNREAEAGLARWAATSGLRLLLVPRDVPYPIPVRLARPDLAGPDRVLAAAAALEIAGGPVVVVSAGTALTVDLATPAEGFLGGAIAPGLALLAAALRSGTSRLPLVPPAPVDDPLGTSTEGAIRAGVFLGWVGAARELVERMVRRAGSCRVFATGGDAELLAPHLPFAAEVRRGLVLDGVRLAVEAGRRRPA
ncbi:MAG: type III pantothenate kinase [Planctomycetes bacterium]|jgi:type III pantothenate kinase|nr:type III pantothenate kinase [Planctomycetota bacterium]